MIEEVILIGGAPCSGKTTLAEHLSQHLGWPWISTDALRGFMALTVEQASYPGIFTFAGRDAVAYLPSRCPSEIVRDQNGESRDVWRGVEAFLAGNHEWSRCIVEGVAVLPELVQRAALPGVQLRSLFIVETDRHRLRQAIYSRGLWDDADAYPDDLKEKEVAWVRLFNRWLCRSAAQYGLPVVPIRSYGDLLGDCLDTLGIPFPERVPVLVEDP